MSLQPLQSLIRRLKEQDAARQALDVAFYDAIHVFRENGDHTALLERWYEFMQARRELSRC